MVSSVNTNISALSALGKKMAVTSNNIANVESEGFKKSRAVLKEGESGSVEVDITRIETPGDTRVEDADGEQVEREFSNVDLAEEITGTIPTQRGYEANLTVIKARDEILGTVLDILG